MRTSAPRVRLWVLVSSGVLIGACGVGGLVKRQAAKDLGCPKTQVHIHSLGATTKRAIGCQRWLDYRCGRAGSGSVYCYKLDRPAGPPPTPAEWAHAHTPGVKDH